MAKRIDPKADRKRKLEDLKRQQKAKERRKTLLTVGIALVAGLGLVLAVVVPAVLKDRREDRIRDAAITTFGVKAAAAECTEEKVDSPIPPEGQHVPTGQRVDYPVAPPSGGAHDGTGTLPVGPGFYTKDNLTSIELAVHSLEHGAVIAWYDEKLPKAEVDELRKIGIASAAKDLRFMAVPWDRGDFTDNKHFVLTSWGHTQRCGKVSGEVVDAFTKKNIDGKDAPEAGNRI